MNEFIERLTSIEFIDQHEKDTIRDSAVFVDGVLAGFELAGLERRLTFREFANLAEALGISFRVGVRGEEPFVLGWYNPVTGLCHGNDHACRAIKPVGKVTKWDGSTVNR